MTDEKRITQLLQAFFDEMGAWEAWCTERDDAIEHTDDMHEAHENFKAESIAALKKIFNKYCSTWDEPKRAVGGTIHFDSLPIYGADLIEIIEIDVSGNTARVVAKEKAGFKHTCIYRLKRTDSGWRIEDNRKRMNLKGVEVNYSL